MFGLFGGEFRTYGFETIYLFNGNITADAQRLFLGVAALTVVEIAEIGRGENGVMTLDRKSVV